MRACQRRRSHQQEEVINYFHDLDKHPSQQVAGAIPISAGPSETHRYEVVGGLPKTSNTCCILVAHMLTYCYLHDVRKYALAVHMVLAPCYPRYPLAHKTSLPNWQQRFLYEGRN